PENLQYGETQTTNGNKNAGQKTESAARMSETTRKKTDPVKKDGEEMAADRSKATAKTVAFVIFRLGE
ncbi:MAG: hypothetical protein OQK59_09610, partial [Chlorobium sp.]|nr:hypothetical protein [Chlorobium sp.]